MRIALAIAPAHAEPSAFVVLRDRLEVGIAKASRLGYDAVELALASADEVDTAHLRRQLDEAGIGVSAISTGRVFAEQRVWLSATDASVRERAVGIVRGLLDLAPEVDAPRVNIGRVRGFVPDGEPPEAAMGRLVDAVRECAEHAASLDLDLVVEPVNRYETNLVNSLVPDGLALMRAIAHPRVRLMPDTFHMNIEDASITRSLETARSHIGYVQVADSNRRAPGQGHIDFRAVFTTLERIGYRGDIGVEILPGPSPDEAARQAVEYLRALGLPATAGDRPHDGPGRGLGAGGDLPQRTGDP